MGFFLELIKVNSKIHLKQYMHENSQEKFENEHICSIRYQTVLYKATGERGAVVMEFCRNIHKQITGTELRVQKEALCI